MARGKALGRSLKMNAIITHSTNFKRMMGVAENSEEALCCPSYIFFFVIACFIPSKISNAVIFADYITLPSMSRLGSVGKIQGN